MRPLAAIPRALKNLFVDDGGLALAVLFWVAAAGLIPVGAMVRGGVLFAGLAGSLAWSCWRAIRRHAATSRLGGG